MGAGEGRVKPGINSKCHQCYDAIMGAGESQQKGPNLVFLEEVMGPSRRSSMLPDDSRDNRSGRRNIVCRRHREG